MKHSFKNSLLFILVILTLTISAVGVTPAFADDSTPPAPATEEPVQPPADEPVATQQPEVTETPAPTDAPEAISTQEVLEQLPADTTVVVTDANGVSISLASQDATDAIVSGDPVWCPATLSAPTPGSNGCTASYTSFQSLLTDLDAAEKTEAGVIWIASSYNSSVNDAASDGFELHGSDFTTMKDYALTIQGGWNGVSGSSVIGSPSLFSGDYLYIDGWAASITIKNIKVDRAGIYSGISVFTTEDINLQNVESSNDTAQYGANLTNSSGTGNVNLAGTNTFNGNTSTGLNISSRGVVNLNNVAANNNDGHGANIIGVGGINLTGSNTFNLNNGFGAVVRAGSANINLNNVTANGNKSYGTAILTTANVTLSGNNEFKNNSTGLYSTSPNNTFNNIFVDGSASDGIILKATNNNTTITCSTIQNNGGYAVSSNGSSPLTLNSVTLGNNTSGDINNAAGTTVTNTPDCTPVASSGETSSVSTDGESADVQDVHYYIIAQTQDQLPAALGQGNTFAFALKVSFTDPETQASDFSVTLSFPIPDGMLDANLAVMFWDGSEWVAMTGGSVVNGQFVITVSTPGTYVLVGQ